MVNVLSPYRREAHRTSKISLYLSATSMLSRSPLPYDTVDVGRHLQDFIEDAVIISARLAATEEGARAVKEGASLNSAISPELLSITDSFTRFWFYILCVGDMPRHHREIELVCKEMFGRLEDDPKMK